jgi:hypothetical protein
MQQINPQAIIDELSRRVQQLTLENVVLSAQIAEFNRESEDLTVIGGDTDEE